MDKNKCFGNKRGTSTAQIGTHSPCKIQKKNLNQHQEVVTLTGSAKTLGSKINNIEKLRQQFVEEIKTVEVSLKESIKNLKSKISEGQKAINSVTTELKESNKILCNQTEEIYSKEQENKILREHVEELYEYQKKIFQNMEIIFNNLNSHDYYANELNNDYTLIMKSQQKAIKILEKELNEIVPDNMYCDELIDLNYKINEQEKSIIQKQLELNQLEMEMKALKNQTDEYRQTIDEYDTKIQEEVAKYNVLKETELNKKIKLLNEIDELQQKSNSKCANIKSLEKDISDLETKIETNSNSLNEIEKNIETNTNDLNSILSEIKTFEETQYSNDQENAITIEKLQEQLNISKNELANIQQKKITATNILQNKISEFRNKFKYYETVGENYTKFETEKNILEKAVAEITKECENRRKDCDEQIKLMNVKLSNTKSKINQSGNQIPDSDKIIKNLETEIFELNLKIANKMKLVDQNSVKLKHTQVKNINEYTLPDMFPPGHIGNVEKERNRKKLYTPTIADDDLEIDSLPFEEQFNRLTQTKTSQLESPEKSKKFFKFTSAKTKKETSARGKTRNKK